MRSSFSNFSWIILSGSPSNCLKKSSKSFKNIEKKKGKLKVMIFRKRKTAQDTKFILHGQTLDIVDTYSYLGIIFYFHLKPTCSKKRSYEASHEFQAEIDQVLHIS
jgi:hypothetical protein